MKRISIFLLISCLALTATAQDRVDSAPQMLSSKSKEISKAVYWNQDSKTGKWVKRYNTDRVYLAEGVNVPNFNTLFLGEYNGYQYLFLDFWKYHWRYPSLEMEWMRSRYIVAGLVTDEQLNSFKNIEVGQELSFAPTFYNDMFKGNPEYSPSFFLRLTETLRSSHEALGEKSDYLEMVTLKRVVSEGQDVIRFLVYPEAIVHELIDSNYFEISYAEYLNLFTPDKNTKFK